MRTRTSIYLDGQALHDVDSRIVIQSINEDAPKLAPKALASGGHLGQHMTSLDRQTMDVSVRFCILGARDTQGRAEVLERVAAWAWGKHLLTVDYRPDRQMHVTCVELPALGNAKEWTDEYMVTFRAFRQPYWESAHEVTASIARAASGSAAINLDSPMRTVLEADVRNAAPGTINSVSLACGGWQMAFEDLNLAPGETLMITHSDGLLVLRISGAGGVRTAYDKRTDESHDEVWLTGGRCEVSVSADGACDWTIKARGRYL